MINLIKNIFGDIFMLYKNFFHFNLSKVVIYLVAILYTIILFIPFGIVFWILYYYLLNSGWLYSIWANLWILIPSMLLVIIWLFILIIAFSYNYVLLTKMNLNYINWKKLKLWKNEYFNFKLFWVFFKTFFLNILILLFPFVVGFILMTILVLSFWWVLEAQKISSSWVLNSFSISSIIILIISIIWFIYLIYKTLFVTTILVDESKWKDFKRPMYYIKKSFKLTSGFKIFFRFVVTAILVVIISLPFSIPLNYFSYNNDRLSNYIEYKVNPDSFSENDFYYIEWLKNEFDWQDLVKLSKTLNKNIKYRMLLEVLNFLFIYGLFEMFIVSFYKRELLWKKRKKIKTLEEKLDIEVEKFEKKLKTKKKTTAKKTTKKVEKKEESKPVKRGRGRPKKTDK